MLFPRPDDINSNGGISKEKTTNLGLTEPGCHSGAHRVFADLKKKKKIVEVF